MPRAKKIYPFDPKDIDLFENKFRNIFESMEDKVEWQVDNVFSFVVPSLVCLTYDLAVNKWKNACYFPQCHQVKRTYATRQKLIQHMQIHHAQEIPNSGRFLSPGDSSVMINGFLCVNCGKSFSRKDHFTQHGNSACHVNRSVTSDASMSASAHVDQQQNEPSESNLSALELLSDIVAVPSHINALTGKLR